jgi:hypothetical protein
MQHKWHKEIKAWADGAEIEIKINTETLGCDWTAVKSDHDWTQIEGVEYRIKPQPKVNEFAHIPYWLCCGSVSPHQHHSFCSEAKAGYPERCRFGTAEEHQKRMEKQSQPKEPQYLYVYRLNNNMGQAEYKIWDNEFGGGAYIGKIKLEE